MAKLLAEAYVWSIVVVGAVFVQAVVFFVMDVLVRVYRIDKFFGKVSEEKIGKKVLPENTHPNVIEISQ